MFNVPARISNNDSSKDQEDDDASESATVPTAATPPHHGNRCHREIIPPSQPIVAFVVQQDHQQEELYKRLIQQALQRYRKQQQQGEDDFKNEGSQAQISQVRRGDRSSARRSCSTPASQDILFGRGRYQRNHSGNRQLRTFCQSQLEIYKDANRGQKTGLTRKIVCDVQSKGGVFLKFHPDRQVWYEVSNKKAREKVSHMMRDVRPHRIAAKNKQN